MSERASQSHYYYRDRAMILTSLDTGIRATELCNLRAKDLNRVTGHIGVRKGKKERLVPISGFIVRVRELGGSNPPAPTREPLMFLPLAVSSFQASSQIHYEPAYYNKQDV